MPALPLPWGRQTSGGSQPHGGLPRQTRGTPFSAALALLSTRRQDLRRVRLEKSAEVCHLPAGSRSALSSSRTPRLAPPCDGRTPRSPRGRPTPLAESQRVPRERAAAQTVTRHPPRCQQPRRARGLRCPLPDHRQESGKPRRPRATLGRARWTCPHFCWGIGRGGGSSAVRRFGREEGGPSATELTSGRQDASPRQRAVSGAEAPPSVQAHPRSGRALGSGRSPQASTGPPVAGLRMGGGRGEDGGGLASRALPCPQATAGAGGSRALGCCKVVFTRSVRFIAS